MKILFFSDVHGSPECFNLLTERIAEFQPDLLALLGDVLYHGPRNPLYDTYAPANLVDKINAYRDKIAAVRGNCDCEVDQMLLKFPMMADFTQIFDGTQRFFLTHGHLWFERNLPPVPAGTILAHGHTHIPEIKTLDNGITIFNPGSTTLPKRGNPNSYGTWDNGVLSVRLLDDGQVFMQEKTG